MQRRGKESGSRGGDGYENGVMNTKVSSTYTLTQRLLLYSFDQSDKFEIPKAIIKLNYNSRGNVMEMSFHVSVPADREEHRIKGKSLGDVMTADGVDTEHVMNLPSVTAVTSPPLFPPVLPLNLFAIKYRRHPV